MPDDAPSAPGYRVMLMFSDNRAEFGPVAGPPIAAGNDVDAIARLTEVLRWDWHKKGYALDDFVQMRDDGGRIVVEGLIREIIE